MENFFGLLKSELLYLQTFESVEQFKKELVEYLEWYNEKKIKVNLHATIFPNHRILSQFQTSSEPRLVRYQ